MKYIAFIRFAALILLPPPVVLWPCPVGAAAEIGRYAFAECQALESVSDGDAPGELARLEPGALPETGGGIFANRRPVTLLVPKNEQGSYAAAVLARDLPTGSEVTAK